MLKFFQGLSSDNETIFVANFYGVKIEPDPKRKKKLAEAIETLGQRYVLYAPIPKVAK